MQIKYFDWFSKYLEDLKSSPTQQNIICPFHEDSEASLSVNLEKGLFHCHGCKVGGDLYSLVMRFEKCSFKEAKRKIIGDARVSVLSEAEVQECHNYLLKKEHLQTMLLQHRGWLLDTIIKFRLGWDDRSKRVTIPIYGQHGELRNIRKYLAVGKATKQNPKFLGIKGHNENYFFPINNLTTTDEYLSKFILVMAGEPDTILANQMGFNAGTFTSGEGAFNRDLLPLFKDKEVYICYDKDLAGMKALKNIGPELMKFSKFVKVIDLPF